jgi:hypothetical protein
LELGSELVVFGQTSGMLRWWWGFAGGAICGGGFGLGVEFVEDVW